MGSNAGTPPMEGEEGPCFYPFCISVLMEWGGNGGLEWVL